MGGNSIWATFLQRWHALLAAREGGTTIFMAMGMLVLVASIGTALDSGRGYLVRSHLSQALDAAALVASHRNTTRVPVRAHCATRWTSQLVSRTHPCDCT